MRNILAILFCLAVNVSYGQGVIPAGGAGNPTSVNLFNGLVQAAVGLKTGTDTAKARLLWGKFSSPSSVDTGTIIVEHGTLFFFDGAHWQSTSGGGGGAVSSVNGKAGAVILYTTDILAGDSIHLYWNPNDTSYILNYTKNEITALANLMLIVANDTADSVRSYGARNLADSMAVTRFLISGFATQEALTDTAIVRAATAQTNLADTSFVLRGQIADTAFVLRQLIPIEINDTAISVRAYVNTISNDTAISVRGYTQTNLIDTAIAIRSAFPSTAGLATTVALTDTAIARAATAQTNLVDTALLKVKYVDSNTIYATPYRADSGVKNTRTWANGKFLQSYTETDPIATTKTITITNGYGMLGGGAAQSVGSNPAWTLGPDSISFSTWQYRKKGDDSVAGIAATKQPQLNGTGLVRMSGTTVSYDNVSYYPFSNPSSFIPLTAISSTATGLSYNNTTGIFSLTSGYAIPTNAQIANWNTAYSNMISSLTTTGSSGAATLSAGVLNIPTPTLAGLGGISLSALSATAPLSYNSGTGAFSIALATGSTNGYLSSTDWTTFNNKGSGSVTTFSSGNLSPLFTTNVATSTITPALTYTLTNAAAHTFFGNFTGSTGAPSYSTPTLASADFANQGTTTTVFHGNASGNPSWGQVVNGDIAAGTIDVTAKVTGVMPIANGGTNASTTTSVNAAPFTFGVNNTIASSGVSSVVGTSPINVSGTSTVTVSVNTTGSGSTVALSVSPAFTGTATATTQTSTDATTAVATDAFVQNNLVPYQIQYNTSASYTTSTTPTTNVTSRNAPVYWFITAQAGALLFNAPTGTFADGQALFIRCKDNGTTRAITYNAVYTYGTSVGPPPSASTAGKSFSLLYIYNANNSKFELHAYIDGL